MLWALSVKEEGCGPSLLKNVLQFVFNSEVVNIRCSTFQNVKFDRPVTCFAHCAILD